MSVGVFFGALKIYFKTIFIILWPLILLPIFLCNNTQAMRCCYVVVLMAGFWVFEVVPSGVTGFLPLILFPLMGILNSDKTAECYMKDANMMFFGGLIVALAIEYCNLHTRVSLHAISLIGCSLRRLNIGLVTLTMLLSMWISNTAATAMMIPIIRAILKELEQQGICRQYKETEDPDEVEPTNVTMCFYISTAYAASIGGMGCIVGSGTNLAFKGIFEGDFPQSGGVSFTAWMMANIPLMLVMMVLGWFWMQIWFMGLFRPHSKDAQAISIGKEGEEIARRILKEKLHELGPLSSHEITVGIMFILVVNLWFFRDPGFPGWATLFKMQVKDATAALFVVFLLMVLPSHVKYQTDEPGKTISTVSPSLISWDYIREKMHWSLIFLMGSGFALGDGVRVSGFGTLVADKLKDITELDKHLILFILVAITSFSTQFTSNVAVANIFLPITSNICRKAKLHPMFLMMPVGLACSFAFCLPVATPPNAIASAPCNMKTIEMIKVGLGMQLLSIFAIMVIFPSLGSVIWDFTIYPDWADITEVANASLFRPNFRALL